MEIGKQHDDFKTSGLKIDELVDGDKMAEMDLTTGFVSCIDFFCGWVRSVRSSSSVTTSTVFRVTRSYASIKNNG